eukprot:719640-Prymnesium_polylepis.1
MSSDAPDEIQTPSTPPHRASSQQMKQSLLADQQPDTEMSPPIARRATSTTSTRPQPEEGQPNLSTSEDGLTESEATARLREYGRNELPELRVPKWKIFLSHFTGIMPGMIMLAVLIEAILAEWPDFWTLLTLLFLNGFVGFWEDMRAGDAVAALKASLKPEAQVLDRPQPSA